MTTDTALLVAREILEEGKHLSEMKFTTDPQIPCDDQVKRYLDMALPIKAMVDDKFKGQSLVALMRGSENEKDV